MSTENHTIFSNDLPPSLGGMINRARKLQRYIVSPLNPCYRAWEMFLVLLVIYSAWISPYEIAFLCNKQDAALFIVDSIVNCFFAADIVLTFFIAYFDTKTYLLIDDPKQIAIRYITTWFMLDICSTMPFHSIILQFTEHNVGLGFNLLSMLRLWRLRRANDLFARFEKDIRFNYFWTRCAKLVSVTLFVVHCAACFNYMIAERYPDPGRTWIGTVYPGFKQMRLLDRYITALYWSIGTLTTTGNMTDLVVHWTCRTRNFRDSIATALQFAKRNRLPPNIQDQILSHVCLKFKTEGSRQQEVLKGLPRAIQSSIAHYRFYPIIQNVHLFRGVSQNFLLQMVEKMEAEYYPPGEDLILQNEAPTNLYVLVSGATEFVSKIDGNDQIIGKASSRGQTFGEIGILCDKPQPYGVRTAEVSQILWLHKATLLNILHANPADECSIVKNLYINCGVEKHVGSSKPRHGKRVTIHHGTSIGRHNKGMETRRAKLVILPDTLEELLKLAAQQFRDDSVVKVVNAENAEIDDLRVVRDGDHLFV